MAASADGAIDPNVFPEGSVQILRCPSLAWPANGANPVAYVERVLVPKELKEANWEGSQLLSLTARLGLPLNLHLGGEDAMEFGTTPEMRAERDSFGLIDLPENPVLKWCSIKFMPNDGMKYKSAQGHDRPTVFVARVDGEDLSFPQLLIMLTYINGEFKTSIGDSLPNAAEPWKQVARFRASMTPEKFVEFWDTDICKMAHDGMECPVKLGCKACGKEEGTFSRCGKCEVVKYCDRECQVKDWKVHKQVCNK